MAKGKTPIWLLLLPTVATYFLFIRPKLQQTDLSTRLSILWDRAAALSAAGDRAGETEIKRQIAILQRLNALR